MKREAHDDDYMEIDLLRLAGALWHRAWAILLAMVLFGGAAFAYAYYLVTPLYQSRSPMILIFPACALACATFASESFFTSA